MQRLSGMDGMFLSVDAAQSTSGVMGGLIIFEPSDDAGAGTRARVIARIEERIGSLPPLRRRLAGSAVAINNNYWIETPNVDVPAHVREVEVDGRGDDHDLAALVAGLQEQKLSFDRPPWEYVVIHGLAGGRIAHLIRLHHSLVDGATVPTILDLLSDEPTIQADPKDSPGRLAGLGGLPLMTALRGTAGRALLPLTAARIQVDTVKYLASRRKDDGLVGAVPAFVGRMLPASVAKVVTNPLNRMRRRHGRPDVLPMTSTTKAPSTVFNGRITERRTYSFSDLPLADFKAVGKAFDATLNDAVVAVCAGAVRRFMADHGEVPEQPLVICIPASVRTGEESERWANHVSMFFAEFPTHLDDPVARIESLRTDLKAAKDNFDAGPTHILRDVMRFVPQTFWNVSVRLMAHGPDWVPGAPWNVVVSNVRGPSQTIRMTGLEMAGYWPVAFLTPGIGLNITLQSYRDRIDFGFIGCPDLTPDLWSLPLYMAESLAELQQAARARPGSAGTKAVTKKSPAKKGTAKKTAKKTVSQKAVARKTTTRKATTSGSAPRTGRRPATTSTSAPGRMAPDSDLVGGERDTAATE